MLTTSLGPWCAAVALTVLTVLLPGQAEAAAFYGGTCNVGVKHKIAKDVYPRTIYYSGGARCTAVVFQDAQVFLYRLPNNNLVDRGNRVRGYTDWSISQGAYPGAEKTERYRVVLIAEAQASIPDAVAAARDQHYSWDHIAGILGTSRTAVIHRYSRYTRRNASPSWTEPRRDS